MSLVTANQIGVQFGRKTILTDIHLTVDKGEIVTLIGPNGAGKSTLVKVVVGLIRPTQGSMVLKHAIQIGYMPQKLVVEPSMPLTVDRFLQLANQITRVHVPTVVDELMIGHLLKFPLQSISGGELQRVLLARALLRQPELLVLDEPVQGVDVTGQAELYHLIMQIRDRYQCGILMVSHDLHLVMAGTDSVICLNKHVCCSGSAAAVSQHPEFLSLFGSREPAKLAVYAHRHNHRHDIGGDVCH